MCSSIESIVIILLAFAIALVIFLVLISEYKKNKRKETFSREIVQYNGRAQYKGNYVAHDIPIRSNLVTGMRVCSIPIGMQLFKASVVYMEMNDEEEHIGVFAIFADNVDTVIGYFNELAEFYKDKAYLCSCDYVYDGVIPITAVTDITVLRRVSKIISIAKKEGR